MADSRQKILADECTAIITAAQAETPFALVVAPEVQFRVDLELPAQGTRKLFVQPVGFNSERIDRGNDKTRTFFIDIIIIEAIPMAPMSAEGIEWLNQRNKLSEEIEALDFSDVESMTWEDSAVVNLLIEGTNFDADECYFQAIRLEFSE